LVYLYMAEEKKTNEKEIPEVVGLDDEDTGEKPAEKTSPIKKFLVPGAIALVSFMIAIAISMFLAKSTEDQATDGSVDAQQEISETDDSGDVDVQGLLQGVKSQDGEKSTVTEDGIDTADIMAGLEFLNYVPDMEAIDKETETEETQTENEITNPTGMTPQDSVDTLNWLAKEMTKLAKEKAADLKRKKELEVLKYKIDQALARINQAESSRIIELARLYDAMRAEEVAKLFENLNDAAVMSILPRMKAANAAKILALMPPKRAANISTKMITVLDE